MSSTTMNYAVTITASASQRRRSSAPTAGCVTTSAVISSPWLHGLRELLRGFRPPPEQLPPRRGHAKSDKDGEAEHGVRRACALVECYSGADHGNREADEEGDQQL